MAIAYIPSAANQSHAGIMRLPAVH